MPAHRIVTTDPPEATQERVENDLRISLRQHLGAVTRVRMERRRQGLSKNRALAEEIEVRRGPDETDDELVESVVRDVLGLIAKDSVGGAWLGTVILENHLEKKPELVRIDVRIEDPDALVTRENETTALISTVGGFLERMCKQMVAIMGAAAAREAAIAELVTGVAKSVGRESEARYKYDWKIQKSRERMDEHRVTEEASVHRSKARWDAVSDVATSWKDVVEVWSRYYTQGRKAGDPAPGPPRAPTQDEIDRILRDEPFDRLRALASEMIAEPDPKRRAEIAKEFRSAFASLDGASASTLRARLLTEIGEKRATEILAWLTMPVG